MTLKNDPFQSPESKSWQLSDLDTLKINAELDCDVVVVGSGAGGATAATTLQQAGYSVVLVEEGGLKTSRDFHMQEGKAYKDLYQEGATRITLDSQISILQGKNVGGSTTVNWTSSFRTPPQTLRHWQEHYGLQGFSPSEMAPWFARVEEDLDISLWQAENGNNSVLRQGCEALGYSWAHIPRNVKGCWNLGFCGMGCPTNAKQSMLVSKVPAFLQAGGRLLYSTEALLFKKTGKEVVGLLVQSQKSSRKLTIKAKKYILAAGGIGSPAILLRSGFRHLNSHIGKRTFLHVTTFSFSHFQEKVEGYYGAPQSVYSDEFQWRQDGKMGFKIEAMPVHPLVVSTLIPGRGGEHWERMGKLPNLSLSIALLRDGFHGESPGGTVTLGKGNKPVLHYPLTPYVETGIRESLMAMGRVQLAAGANWVIPSHSQGKAVATAKSLEDYVQKMDFSKQEGVLGSAHVMGGCAMGDHKHAVTDDTGKVIGLNNLYVMDGSLFPTSVGANPQLSIYGISLKLSSLLARDMGS